ncbi:MAG: hypothetical protein IPI23_10715 [Bacteroidetes bacterium]|nr:hypothetical protein [Bacteroidota bacterium]
MTLKHARLFTSFVLIFSSANYICPQPGGAAIFSLLKARWLMMPMVIIWNLRPPVVKRICRFVTSCQSTTTNTAGELKIAEIGPGGYSVETVLIGYEKLISRSCPQGSGPVNDGGVQ